MKDNSIRKIISLVLVLCFVFALAGNCYAVNTRDNKIPITERTKSVFESHGIYVSDDAVLRVVTLKDATENKEIGSAYCLTQIRNGICESNFLADLYLDEDNNDVRAVLSSNYSSTYTGDSSAYAGKFWLSGTAKWDTYNYGCIRPLSVSCMCGVYAQYLSSVTINYISVEYYVEDNTYALPSYTLVNTIPHSIIKDKLSPSYGVTYSNTLNPFPSSYVVDPYAHGMQNMFFHATINGSPEIGLNVQF